MGRQTPLTDRKGESYMGLESIGLVIILALIVIFLIVFFNLVPLSLWISEVA